MPGISNDKKALLHVAKNQLGLDDDIYREILRQEAGVVSAKELSPIGFDRVMRRFMKLGFRRKVKPKARQSSNNNMSHNGLATKREVWKVRQLETELGWADNPKRLRGFLKKYAGIERLEWLPHSKAWRVIEALKSLLEKQDSPKSGEGDLAK